MKSVKTESGLWRWKPIFQAVFLSVLGLAGCATQPGMAEFGTATLHGMVYNESGSPVAWATVSIGSKRARSDINGRFSFANVPRGQISFAATADGHLRTDGTAFFVNRTQILYLRLQSREQREADIRELLARQNASGAVTLARASLEQFQDDTVFTYLLAIAEINAGNHDEARLIVEHIKGSGLQAVDLLLGKIDSSEEDY